MESLGANPKKIKGKVFNLEGLPVIEQLIFENPH